ncbi:MAG: hypothetical protein IIW27_05960, partial [Clostridia bacterium]|nr:hypothetical protein [Clostridia bacterium]
SNKKQKQRSRLPHLRRAKPQNPPHSFQKLNFTPKRNAWGFFCLPLVFPLSTFHLSFSQNLKEIFRFLLTEKTSSDKIKI